MSDPVEFYFDFSSPYGYLASTRIEGIAALNSRACAWRPFLLGTLFKIVGSAPTTSYPMKGDYGKHDIERTARRLRVPLRWPASFPQGTVSPARAFYWIADQDEETAKSFARAVYHGYFGEGEDVTSPESTADIAATVGLDRAAVLAALQEPAVKERLKQENDQAIARGVFGSPFVFIDGEPFWGNDKLDEAQKWLHSGGW